ncbi:MAG: TRAP transporter large permease [bacterium]|nr:TRAP transporter large permease [bacterium]
MLAITTFAILLGVIFIGCPVAVALLLAGTIPIIAFTTLPLSVIAQKLYVSMDTFTLLAIPFFVLAGGLMEKGGISKRLVDFANSLVGWMPGGLAVVTFLASAFFGAISGSSSATIAAIGMIMVPALLKEGYDLKFALATVASAGWLGVIVPPSIPMILYAMSIGRISIGDLFMGGFLPGFLLAGQMSVYAIWFGYKYNPVRHPFKIKEVCRTFIRSLWALGMPLIIMGGIYGGIFTATEAAAVAVLYGLIVGRFILKELQFSDILPIIKNAAITTSVLMFIVASASLFGYYLTVDGVPTTVGNFITSLATSKMSFMFLVMLLLLFVGTFMDTAPAILILAPLFAPLLGQYGIDNIAFGVSMIVALGIGMVTPPVGINIYVTASLTNTKTEMVVNKHLFIYMLLAVIGLVLLVIFPQIITFLITKQA